MKAAILIYAFSAATAWAAGAQSPSSADEGREVSLSTSAAITAEQLYRPSLARDPFKSVPVSAASARKRPAAEATPGKPPDVKNLALAGIVTFPGDKRAMLYDSQTGAAYYLVKGRLLDRKGRQVPRISGVIQEKVRQVTLMSEDNAVLTLAIASEKNPRAKKGERKSKTADGDVDKSEEQ
ncbi:MAG: hypothetical protein PHP45_08775 [Elusimicrobiales bacterium]|nr:hypothetical protein [Elusimicrobiales bacterium]